MAEDANAERQDDDVVEPVESLDELEVARALSEHARGPAVTGQASVNRMFGI